MKQNNKHSIPGFPWKGKFTTRSEVAKYFSNDEGIQCLLCGRFMGTLQNHLQLVHGVSHEEYRERYGLGVVYVDKKNVNLEMVKEGLAEVYRRKPAPRFDNDPYQKAEDAARSAGIGMWSLSDKYISPKDWRKTH